MALVAEKTYPESLELHDVQRVRVYLSGANTSRMNTYHVIARQVEEFFGARGSSVQPQEGRWHGAVETGAVIELCVDVTEDLGNFAAYLRSMIQPYGLTAYVTAERVTAVEVY